MDKWSRRATCLAVLFPPTLTRACLGEASQQATGTWGTPQGHRDYSHPSEGGRAPLSQMLPLSREGFCAKRLDARWLWCVCAPPLHACSAPLSTSTSATLTSPLISFHFLSARLLSAPSSLPLRSPQRIAHWIAVFKGERRFLPGQAVCEGRSQPKGQ